MRAVVLSVLLFVARAVVAEDMQRYLVETRKLVEEKKYEEALKRMLWFHDHAVEQDQSMYGVRLSYALSDWKELGMVYPPAAKAMRETRERKAATILKGASDVHLFHDVAALDRTLEEPEQTLNLFEEVSKQGEGRAEKFWPVAKDVVFAGKRHDIARKYIGNVVREFAEVKARHEEMLREAEREEFGGAGLRGYSERTFVKETLQLIALALALEDRPAALEVQKQALAVVKDHRIRDAIPVEGK